MRHTFHAIFLPVLLIVAGVLHAAEPRLLVQRDFDATPEGSVPEEISDNSDWKQGAVTFSVVPSPKGKSGRSLRCGVKRFGQFIIGRLPIEDGHVYRVAVGLASLHESRPLVVQVRQYDTPWTVYGKLQGNALPDGLRHPLTFTFTAGATDPQAFIYVIAGDGDGELLVDDLTVADLGVAPARK